MRPPKRLGHLHVHPGAKNLGLQLDPIKITKVLGTAKGILLAQGHSSHPGCTSQLSHHIPDELLSFTSKPIVVVEATSIIINPNNPDNRASQQGPHLRTSFQPVRQLRPNQTLLPGEVWPQTLNLRNFQEHVEDGETVGPGRRALGQW
jgi:hypothetical protein